jgi:predicted transcriptional regulator
MATTTIRVSARTREQVAALARASGVSQSAYLERLVDDEAASQWESGFWAQMGAYDAEDLADLAEQEATYDADFGDVE